MSKDCYGLVVASSTDEFTQAKVWENMDAGILLITNEIGLVHYSFDDEEMRFVSNYRSDMSEGMSKDEIEALLKRLLKVHALN